MSRKDFCLVSVTQPLQIYIFTDEANRSQAILSPRKDIIIQVNGKPVILFAKTAFGGLNERKEVRGKTGQYSSCHEKAPPCLSWRAPFVNFYPWCGDT